MKLSAIRLLWVFAFVLMLPHASMAATIFAAPQIGGLNIGNGNSFGEVFVMPALDTRLVSFEFGFDNFADTSTTYAGYVYAWDSATNRVTGSALYSGTDTLPAYPSVGSSGYVTFLPGLDLVANQSYIAFVGPQTNARQQFYACGTAPSIDCPVNQSPNTSFYQTTGVGEAGWSGAAWIHPGYRVAFNINLQQPESGPVGVPEPTSLLLFSIGAVGVFAAGRRKNQRIQ